MTEETNIEDDVVLQRQALLRLREGILKTRTTAECDEFILFIITPVKYQPKQLPVHHS